MDKYIEVMAFYWIDWQQTAIANTRYSVILAVLAFFIGALFIAISKSGKIRKLQKHLMQNGQLLDQANKTQDELVNQGKSDAVKITNLQQQLEQSSINMQQQAEQASATLQQEIEKFQADIAKKDQLFIESTKEKQLVIDESNLKLNEKLQLSKQLQNKLDEQKSSIAQYDEVKSQLLEVTTQLSDTTTELNKAKSELETELQLKDTLIEKVDKQEKSTKNQLNRTLELESQLAEINKNNEIEKVQQQKKTLGLEKKTTAIKVEPVKETLKPLPVQTAVPGTIKKSSENPPVSVTETKPIKNEEVKISVKEDSKLGLTDKVMGWFSSMDNALEGEDVNKDVPKVESKPVTTEVKLKKADSPIVHKQAKDIGTEPQTISTPPKPIKKEHTNAVDSKSGLTDKVMGWFSSMDSALEGEDVNTDVVKADSELNKLAATEVKSQSPVQPTVLTNPVENKKKVAPEPLSVDKVAATNFINEGEETFSGKLAEVADKMDSFQNKLKGFYKRSKS